MSALFEPLVATHPETMEPMAGLATHYLTNRGGTRYTFYLRGHASPQGTRLADASALPTEFSRGQAGAPCRVPARWSDGTTITADDCVESWRRYFAPETANADAYEWYCVAGAEAVASGKIPPEELGVCAVDPFTVQVDLRAPAPYFLMLCSIPFVTPRHVIGAARRSGREASWTDAGRIATSGPFRLKEHRPREHTLVCRNPYYYDSHLVGIDEIEFSAADGVTVLNLFRAGLADSMEGRVLPLQLTSRLRGQGALNVRPACASHAWRINTRSAPLNNVLCRYALNMAMDKNATARYLGMGQTAAKSRVPRIGSYAPPASLIVSINGRDCDVLAFDPRAARELWAQAAGPGPHAPLPIHYPARLDSRLLSEIQQAEWNRNLGIVTDLRAGEPAAFNQFIYAEGNFTGVAEDSLIANYPDPYDLLSLYTSGYPSWSDPRYDRKLAAATSITDPALRMKELAACESALLQAMPCLPIYFDTWVYLERPEIRGLRLNPLGVPAFKYGWIDGERSVQ